MRKTKLVAVLAVSIFALTNVHAQGGSPTNELRKLIAEYHEAQSRMDAGKFKKLLDDDFKETTTSGSGTVSATRSELVAAPKNEQERVFIEIYSTIKTNNAISGFTVQAYKNTATFAGNLLRTQSLTVRAPKSVRKTAAQGTVEDASFKNTEFFQITGTAIYKNGAWLLVSLQRDVPKASDSIYGRDWRDVIDENIKFGLAIAALALDRMDKSPKPMQ